MSVSCFIDKCLMRSFQDEKKKKKKGKRVPGVVGVDDTYPLPQ